MMTRREFSRVASLLPFTRAARAEHSVFQGVRIGNMTYSFRDLPVEAAIRAQAEAGIGFCELEFGHIERPLGFTRDAAGRAKLRQWRLTEGLDRYKAVRKLFDEARLPVWGLIWGVRDDFTDEEIERGFQFAQVLGARVMTGSSTVSVAPRVARFAEKYRMPFGFHNHSRTEHPNEIATPESFEKVLAVSPRLGINFDVGHFFAAGYDPVDWMRKNHARITNIDLCDRKAKQGPQLPWGEGETPLREVLLLMKRERYPFPATIQYEYPGKSDSLTEVKRCFEFCKQVLA
jgi:sugar phosphate isomerase/epimerase